MKKVLLSICIPTYNRAEYLDEAINSVLVQITEDIKDKIEICVSDNNSIDNTKDIILSLQKKSTIPIIYHENSTNIGADMNFLKVIEIILRIYWQFLQIPDSTKSALDISKLL